MITSLILIIILIFCCFKLIKWRYNYWQRLGFFVPEFEPIIGHIRGMGFSEFQAITMDRVYKNAKGSGPICGMYFFTEPTALVVEPDILKHILIKDFNVFHDRGLYVNEETDPLSGHLFGLEGARWRQIRTKVTPVFSSGKLKGMFRIMLEVTHNLVDYLDELHTTKRADLEMKDIFCRFSTDVIASCAYGIETNTLRDEKSRLRELGAHIFHSHYVRNMYLMMINLFRRQAKQLNLRFVERHNQEYFMSIIRETIEHRERTGYQRNDYINLLIQLKNRGAIDDDNVGHLSFNEVAAMCFTFFLAGFETSSNVITFCLYELCLQPEIQQRLRNEIKKGLEKHNGNLNYESAADILYLDQVINETLRKWPSVSNLMRMTKEDYKIPNTNLTLPKDTWLIVPIYSIHRDERFFENPEQFDPDRFSPKNAANIPPFHYLPFGEGPRICLGVRFGFMEVRLTLIALLTKFQFKLSPKTTVPVDLLPQVFAVLAPRGGMWMNIERLKDPYHYESPI